MAVVTNEYCTLCEEVTLYTQGECTGCENKDNLASMTEEFLNDTRVNGAFDIHLADSPDEGTRCVTTTVVIIDGIMHYADKLPKKP